MGDITIYGVTIKLCFSKCTMSDEHPTEFVGLKIYDIYDLYKKDMGKGELYDKLADYIMAETAKTIVDENNVVKCVCWLEYTNNHGDMEYTDIDIEVYWDGRNETIEALRESINEQIENIKNTDPINDPLIKTIILKGQLKLAMLVEQFNPLGARERIESLKIINKEKNFKEDLCGICTERKPNALFCSCGHISICSTCRKSLNNKNKCITCKEISMSVRIIE